MTIDLDQLRRESAAYSDSHAPHTRASYRLDWLDFECWCLSAGLASLPAAPETVLLYLTHLLHAHKISTARRHAASINARHREAGLSLPADYRTAAMFAGAQRSKAEQPHQKQAITVAQLRQMCATQVSGGPRQIRNRAILALGFASALRRANLASLDMADVTFQAEGLVLQIRSEKQDRKGVGRTVAVSHGEHPETCAVRALRAWIAVRGICPGALFTAAIGGHVQIRRVHPGLIAQVVKEAAISIGLDSREYSGHSTRAGCATAALEAGIGEIAVADHLGHHSLSTLRRYYRRTDPFVGTISGRIGL